MIMGYCSKCEGTAYFTKMAGMPAFCPMCGEDADKVWEQTTEQVGIELEVRNDNPELTVDFCVGMKEYSLKPNEKITIEANDGDYVYFDAIQVEVE